MQYMQQLVSPCSLRAKNPTVWITFIQKTVFRISCLPTVPAVFRLPTCNKPWADVYKVHSHPFLQEPVVQMLSLRKARPSKVKVILVGDVCGIYAQFF